VGPAAHDGEFAAAHRLVGLLAAHASGARGVHVVVQLVDGRCGVGRVEYERAFPFASRSELRAMTPRPDEVAPVIQQLSLTHSATPAGALSGFVPDGQGLWIGQPLDASVPGLSVHWRGQSASALGAFGPDGYVVFADSDG
jgi:hypothetical protein